MIIHLKHKISVFPQQAASENVPLIKRVHWAIIACIKKIAKHSDRKTNKWERKRKKNKKLSRFPPNKIKCHIEPRSKYYAIR